MKKITLIAAAAALAALPALAQGPRQTQVALQPKKMTARTISSVAPRMGKANARFTTADMRRLAGYKAVEESTPVVPDDVVDVQPGTAVYSPSSNAFYLGMSPAWGGYVSTCGLTGIRNAIGFRNLTADAESFSWLWREPVGVNDAGTEIVYEDHVSTDSILRIQLKPDLFFRSPELKAVFDGETVSYIPAGISGYYCGGSTFSWGLTSAPEGTTQDEVEISDVMGVGVAAMPLDDGTFYLENAFMLPTAMIPNISNQFDKNGTYKGWSEYFSQITGYTYTNPVVTGFSTIVPAMPSPYQLGSMWMPFMAELTADLPLTATVYTFGANGTIDYEHPIAKGQTIVSKDWDAASEDMPVMFFEALDEFGYETEIYPSIPTNTPLVVTVSGFNKDNVKYFIPLMYEGSAVPVELQDVAEDLYPAHACVQINMDETPVGGTEADKVNLTYEFPNPYFYSNQAQDSVFMATDYLMYFDVEFPSIVNIDSDSADKGTANFNTHFEKAGGTNEVMVYCDYDISQLIGMEEMTVSVSDESWLSYETKLIIPDSKDELPYTQVSITAKALPDNVEGRSGYVLFTGFACDFLVRVTQGTVAGINEISATPVAKGTQLFDLQGRRLTAAPANGIYIERNGSTTTKRIAR